MYNVRECNNIYRLTHNGSLLLSRLVDTSMHKAGIVAVEPARKKCKISFEYIMVKFCAFV